MDTCYKELGIMGGLAQHREAVALIGKAPGGTLQVVCGESEPCLYGVILKYRQTMKALVAACAAAGLIVGIFTPIYYVMSSAQ